MSAERWSPSPAEGWAYDRGRVYGQAWAMGLRKGSPVFRVEAHLVGTASVVAGVNLGPAYLRGRMDGARYNLCWHLGWLGVQLVTVLAQALGVVTSPALTLLALGFMLTPGVMSTAEAYRRHRTVMRDGVVLPAW